jgi:signal transduction histidine kinase
MNSRYQRATDLLELKELLQTTLVGLTMDEVADQFEVSRRTAERLVAAIRDRFPGVQTEFRNGKKYWSMPKDAGTRPLELPSDLARLSDRLDSTPSVAQPEQDVPETLRTIGDAVLGRSPVGIFVLDAEFRVLWINDSLARYFGVDPASVIGRDKRALIRDTIRNHLEDPDYFEQRVLATYEDNTYVEHFQFHILPAPGREERWLEHWSQPIEVGPYAGGRVEHYVDVSERERDQLQRRVELKNLQARLAETQTGEGPRKAAGDVAHSIRSPLSEIIAIARRSQGEAGADPADFRNIVDLADCIGDAVDHMLRLTDRDVASVEATNVLKLLDRVALEARMLDPHSNIEVLVDAPADLDRVQVQADPKRLRRALHELVENATYAMPEGGRIMLVAKVQGNPGRVVIRVIDDGPGIDPELRGLIFESFYTTRKDAAGLGLAVARRTAEEHSGSLGLDEGRESGACFVMEIPVSRACD